MGFLRKLTGVQGQIDSAAAAVEASRANADATIAATQQATSDAQATMNAQAKAAALQLSQQVARDAAAQKAADAVGTPMEEAVVSLDSPIKSRAASRSRRAFGRGTTGVQI